MAGQLRCPAGFLGGGGVTPSPPPKPDSRLVRSILVPYGVSGDVYIPVDKYGRIICMNDDGVRFTPWWVDGESPAWFDDAADQVLVNAMSEHGYVDALQSDGDPSHPFTISLDDETEVITWNDATKDFNVNIPLWQNGTANMYYRAVPVNGRDLTVLCDADGKAIRAPFGTWQTAVFTVGNNGAEIDSITEGSSIAIADVITACGGATDVDNVSGGESIELLVNGDFVQVVNADDTTTTPTVPIWSKQLTYAAKMVESPNSIMICDSTGRAIRLINNTAENYGSLLLVTEDDQGKLVTNDVLNLQGNYDWIIDIPESDHYIEDNYRCFPLNGMTYKIASYDWDVDTHGPQFTPVVPIPYHAS